MEPDIAALEFPKISQPSNLNVFDGNSTTEAFGALIRTVLEHTGMYDIDTSSQSIVASLCFIAVY